MGGHGSSSSHSWCPRWRPAALIAPQPLSPRGFLPRSARTPAWGVSHPVTCTACLRWSMALEGPCRGPTVHLRMAPSGPGTATGWAFVHISGCLPHSYSLCLPWDHGATLGSAPGTRVCTAEPRRGARLGRVPCRVYSQHWPQWEAGAHHGGKHLSGYQRSGWSSSLQPQEPPSPASPVLPSRCPCLGTQHCIRGAPVRRPAQPGPQPLLLAWPGLASTESEQGSEGSKCCVRLQPLWCLEGAAQAGLGTKHRGLPQSPGPSLDHLCLCSAGCGESPHHSHRNRDGLVGTSSPS